MATNQSERCEQHHGIREEDPPEHILLRPGMYIGQTELASMDSYIYNSKLRRMEKKKLSVPSAL